MIVALLATSLIACSSVIPGSDNRDPATLTLAQPTIAGGGVGASCGWSDSDACRPDLICDSDWGCVAPDPPPDIACTRDVQCPPSIPSCNRGLCAALGSEGNACASSSNCLPGFECSVGGACRSIRAWCTPSSGCPPAELCVDNACRPRW